MNPRIVTVSPNTSTDRVSVVAGFHVGATARTRRSFDQAGGSGAHASGVVRQLGGETLAIVLIGGGNGRRWEAAARRQDIPFATVPIAAENRSSFVLIDDQLGKVAEIIDPGPKVGPREERALTILIERELRNAAVLVLSGSLPPGMPDDLYARCIERARRSGVPVVLDAHSEPLRLGLAARPWLIKPNLDEFHQLLGVPSTTMAERVAALRAMAGAQAEIILLSMAAEGALLATSEAVWRITPPAQPSTLPGSTAINPVGCGDALVGAFCHHWVRSGDLVASARWGIAAAHVNLGKVEVPSCPRDEVAALVDEVGVEEERAPVPTGREVGR